MDDTIERVREDLRERADELASISGKRFFKEEVQLYGVSVAAVGPIARKYLKDIQHRGKAHALALGETLWQSGYLEESFIACEWAYAFRGEYVPEDFSVFERWVSQYVSNWAACDTLCNHTIGSFVDTYPEFVDSLKTWAHAENRWMRRASAVTLIVPARKGRFLREVFEIADILLLDEDDMVRKGYGWMLKAAADAHRSEVFDYVVQHKAVMPRTALRYAIEKMPPEMKAIAMAK